ncbi:hypothetical protein KS4_05980 [Poriferisphaera corsica]|uniref:Sulfate exporter family transporter n=1 Tax=Poriferisphaera corsica TaxID=2528020 RepID=A0A517YQQ6_9BACT|nr:putative sulfate exporter family transporter [Poriferisphaera corsica]QDU32566.1 hypothetical protein KS4_05980 [Poriferisphaera corsica]
MNHKTPTLWICLGLAVLIFIHSPAIALCTGVAISLIVGNSHSQFTANLAKYLLQAAVVFLGFGLQLNTILHVGLQSFSITAISITTTLALGLLLARSLKIDTHIALLTSSGTAICGGSAIAAMGPSIKANQHAIGVSLAVVFLLNAIALFIFPPIGKLVGLTQTQFGLWSALAIHDTSSVIGAASAYGPPALAIATTVKLTRALWIMPLSITCSKLVKNQNTQTNFPLFLLGFIAAASLRSYFPNQADFWQPLNALGQQLMILSLFFIGAGLTRQSLKIIRGKLLLMASLLWLITSSFSLILVKLNIYHLQPIT